MIGFKLQLFRHPHPSICQKGQSVIGKFVDAENKIHHMDGLARESRQMKSKSVIVVVFSIWFGWNPVSSQELKTITLPTPRMEGGKPLMQALKERQSIRIFGKDTLSMQTMSDLLWAAFGINRPDSKKRTAPSARNAQEIEVYVALKQGLYLYDAPGSRLVLVLAQDIRELTGTQDYVKNAPVNLIFVANLTKSKTASEEEKILYPALDTGYISQNVYLFCASEGLATVARGLVNRTALAKKMGLRPDQKIILAQSVGYPVQ